MLLLDFVEGFTFTSPSSGEQFAIKSTCTVSWQGNLGNGYTLSLNTYFSGPLINYWKGPFSGCAEQCDALSECDGYAIDKPNGANCWLIHNIERVSRNGYDAYTKVPTRSTNGGATLTLLSPQNVSLLTVNQLANGTNSYDWVIGDKIAPGNGYRLMMFNTTSDPFDITSPTTNGLATTDIIGIAVGCTCFVVLVIGFLIYRYKMKQQKMAVLSRPILNPTFSSNSNDMSNSMTLNDGNDEKGKPNYSNEYYVSKFN
jgi:hypothetical protein